MTDALTRFREMAERARAENPPPEWTGDMDAQGIAKLPHSMEAEQSVIGALLIDNVAFDRVADLVAPEDFYRHEHREAFAAIAQLIGACKDADVLTVFEHLQRQGKADGVTLAYLNATAAGVPSASNARRYAEIVREKSVRRAMIAAADVAAAVARDEQQSIAEGLDRIDRLYDRLRGTQVRKGPAHLSSLLVGYVDRVNELFENRDAGGLVGMPTGIPNLDHLLGGLQPGKLVVLGARPGNGKSSAVRHIGVSAAASGSTVLLLSMEMPASEIAGCLVAQLGSIDGHRLNRGDLESDDWSRLTEAVDVGARLPLYVDDEGGLSLAAIRNKARMVKGLRLLIVDYLQLSTSSLKNATTNDQVAEVSKGLKALALSMGICVVLLSQLNRDIERRSDKEPALADLRDSGAIEQDADIVVLLWTHLEFQSGAERVVGWKVAKHRGGPKGRFGMVFQPATYRWTPAPEGALDAPQATAGPGKGKVFE
jgi:replicative DNA helicase